MAVIRDIGGNVHQLVRGARATIRVVTPGGPSDHIRGLELEWAVLPDYPVTPSWRQFMQATTRHAERDFHELLAAHLCWRLWHDC